MNIEKKKAKIKERIDTLQASLNQSLQQKKSGAAEINVDKVLNEIQQLSWEYGKLK